MRHAVPALAGASCVFGFAPFYAWPVPILALAALFAAWERTATPRMAALDGLLFGLGYFIGGVSWALVAMHVSQHTIAIVAVILLGIAVITGATRARNRDRS